MTEIKADHLVSDKATYELTEDATVERNPEIPLDAMNTFHSVGFLHSNASASSIIVEKNYC